MPTYHIGCNDCFEDFEEVRSIKIGPPEECKYCSSKNVEQIFYPPPILTSSEPKTLGHLGDRNRDKMSQSEFSEKTHEQEVRSSLGRKKMGLSKLERPWWRPDSDKVDHRLGSMTPEDTKNFIKTGHKPFKDLP